MAITKKAYEKILQQAKKLPKQQRLRLVRELVSEENTSREIRFPKDGKVTKLGGLLEGYDFTEEEITEARREMWGNFGKLPE